MDEPTRAGHWRKDRCDVYVGRGSKWGNPYVFPGGAARSRYAVTEAADPLGAYEAHVRANAALVTALPELRGKVLGCYCVRLGAPPPAPGAERCHAQVLVRLVDELVRVLDAREGVLFYAVTANPSDFPGRLVVRRHLARADGQVYPEAKPWAVELTLEAAREKIPAGLSRIDPVIVEVWA